MNAIQSIYGKSAVKENYLDKVGIVICNNAINWIPLKSFVIKIRI